MKSSVDPGDGDPLGGGARGFEVPEDGVDGLVRVVVHHLQIRHHHNENNKRYFYNFFNNNHILLLFLVLLLFF